MKEPLANRFYEWVCAFPRWLKVMLSLAFVAAGVAWVWLVGQMEWHHDGAKIGFVMIGVGIVGFYLSFLGDENGYHF